MRCAILSQHVADPRLAVLGGFISPSHDLYVGPKCQRLRTAFAAAHHRCDLAELLIRDLDEAVPKEGGMQGEGNGWLHLSRWESGSIRPPMYRSTQSV